MDIPRDGVLTTFQKRPFFSDHSSVSVPPFAHLECAFLQKVHPLVPLLAAGTVEQVLSSGITTGGAAGAAEASGARLPGDSWSAVHVGHTGRDVTLASGSRSSGILGGAASEGCLPRALPGVGRSPREEGAGCFVESATARPCTSGIYFFIRVLGASPLGPGWTPPPGGQERKVGETAAPDAVAGPGPRADTISHLPPLSTSGPLPAASPFAGLRDSAGCLTLVPKASGPGHHALPRPGLWWQ